MRCTPPFHSFCSEEAVVFRVIIAARICSALPCFVCYSVGVTCKTFSPDRGLGTLGRGSLAPCQSDLPPSLAAKPAVQPCQGRTKKNPGRHTTPSPPPRVRRRKKCFFFPEFRRMLRPFYVVLQRLVAFWSSRKHHGAPSTGVRTFARYVHTSNTHQARRIFSILRLSGTSIPVFCLGGLLRKRLLFSSFRFVITASTRRHSPLLPLWGLPSCICRDVFSTVFFPCQLA